MKDIFSSNKRAALLFSVIPFLIILGGIIYAPRSFRKPETASLLSKGDEARAIEAAQKIFSSKRAAGVSMSNGPCLADEVIPGWAADVAHSPRQPVDDLPENQCGSLREGTVEHFVEIDTEGKFLRSY